MVLAAATPINAYTGNSGASSYPFTFPVFIQTQLVVVVTGPTPAFTVYNLVLGTDYTVTGLNTGNNPAATGNIVLTNSGQAWLTAGNLTTGYTITIYRSTSIAQTFSIRNQGDYLRGFLENALDVTCMIAQELAMNFAQQISLPLSILPSAFSLLLPANIQAFPGYALGVNAAGNGLALVASLVGLPLPVAIASGGTNSSTALANGKAMASSGGKIVESAIGVSGGKFTGLSAGANAGDSVRLEQVGPLKITTLTGTTRTSNTGTSYADTVITNTITPLATTKRIRIIAQSVWTPSGTNEGFLTLTRGGVNIAPSADGFLNNNSQDGELPFTVIHDDTGFTPVTSTTYAVAIKIAGGGTGWVNQNQSNWKITIEEWAV